jgi:hypothetical protein
MLLAFCPLGDEEDLEVHSLYDLMANTLATINEHWWAVLFTIGDDCSVNKSIG